MVILLYGSDSWSRTKRLNQLVADFRKNNSNASVERFDLASAKNGNNGEKEFLRLKEFLLSRSIFADKKLAIVESAWQTRAATLANKKTDAAPKEFGNRELKKLFQDFLESTDTTLVISGEGNPPAALAFLLKKPVKSEKYEEPKGQKIKALVKKESEELGMSLNAAALDLLCDSFGSDVWAIITELQKLRSFYPLGKEKTLTAENIKEAGDYSESNDFYAFINAVNYKSGTGEKLTALEKLFFDAEEPAKIFNIMAASRYLSSEALQKMADYDVMIKSGRLEYEEVLVDIALSK